MVFQQPSRGSFRDVASQLGIEIQELDEFVADLESRRNKDEKKIGLLSVMPLGSPTLKMVGF